jgi:VWFA-related protein
VLNRAQWSGAAAMAACAVALSAQSPQQKPEQRPVFRAEANFVRVDAYPTADGKPVLDLTAEDFEIREDGVPQKVATFERVIVQRAGPQTSRVEPNTIETSRQMAANPRNRVFVLFLDLPHVTIDGTWQSREPLIRMIDNILGEDDLVGIMTPDMAASDVVLGRKTDVIAGGLRSKMPWGTRHSLKPHPREEMYRKCYPWPELEDVVEEMGMRRNERATLEALDELVHYLSGIREDRKAIVTVTEGWPLFRPNPDLTRLRTLSDNKSEPMSGGPAITVGPDGRLRMGGDARAKYDVDKSECDQDRGYLAAMDNWEYIRAVIDRANRWNASFYTIDPRGLPVFDDPIGPKRPPPPSVSFRNVTIRHDHMRMLADNTDGLAVMNSNDLDSGLKRISDDLSSYYLIGYYSTNTTYDGGYRQLKVTVKRPGVNVRARPGYRAATEEEVTSARARAVETVPPEVAAVREAIAELARLRSETGFRIQAAAGRGEPAHIWVAGEFRPATGPARTALKAEVQVSGDATGAATIDLPAGQRSFLVRVPLDRAAASGGLDVRARLVGAATPQADMVRLDPSVIRAVLYRRGPATGNQWQPAGDPRFSRTDRARLELPLSLGGVTGRVLDRNGAALSPPVVIGERTDAASGERWTTADVTLAPLGPGDYVIELQAGPERVLTPLRVTR